MPLCISQVAVYIHVSPDSYTVTERFATWYSDNQTKLNITKKQRARGGLQCFKYGIFLEYEPTNSKTWML